MHQGQSSSLLIWLSRRDLNRIPSTVTLLLTTSISLTKVRISEKTFEEVHLEYLATGPKSAIIDVSSGKGDVTMHLLGNTDAASAMKELSTILATIQNTQQPVGEAVQILARPLALVLVPDASPDVLALSRYPIALAAAFFETKST